MRGVKLKYLFILFGLLTLAGAAQSQSRETDSLRKALPLVEDMRSESETLLRLSSAWLTLNLDSAAYYLQRIDLNPRRYPKLQIDRLNIQGNLLQRQSMQDSALQIYDRALQQALDLNYIEGLAKLYNNIALVNTEQGDFTKALEGFIKATEFEEQLDNKTGQAQGLNNIGVVLYYQGEMEKSLTYFLESVLIHEQLGNLASAKQGYNNIGAINEGLQQYEEALKFYRRAYRIADSLGDRSEIGIAQNNLAGAYNGLGQREEAEIWYLRAIATNQDNQDFYSVALNYMNIAGFYADGRQYEKAEDYYQKGETLARTHDYKNILQDLLAKRAAYWAERGEYSLAYQDQVAYEAVKDSIFNKTKAEAIAEAETKYNTERKERELAENKVALTQEQLKVQRQRTYSISLASVLLLVGLSSVGIIRQQRQKRQQLEREAELKEQLAKAEMQRKMEEERMRISRDLHDHIGAQLTIMGAQIDKMAFNEESEVSRAELEKISDHARDTMAQLRETIWAMSNDSIELDMLVAKLRDFLNRISWDQRSYQIEYEMEKSLTLGPGQAINLFRVCQEGIQNALKYADFKRLCLSFRQTDGYLLVRLEDDGIGILDLNIAKGYGIKNMAGRMNQVGGEFQIRRGKEKGTCLEFKLPLNTTSAV